MKSKGFEIAIYALMAALIVSLFTVSLTYGRYADEIESSGSDYDSNIEYIVSEKVEVHNMEEFIGAIENGYSNVYIADDADEEIIITTGVTDVSVDLIINLNGHTIVRNNRDPILNVQDGIRLTVTDTSTEKTGSFYNPVGSVLQISGGTLTVTGGLFESGPRKDEYGAASGTVNAKVFVKSGSEYVSEEGTISMPDLTGDSTGIYYEDGIPGNKYVSPDTYLYYSEEDSSDPVSVKAERGSADFYYKYTSGGTRKIIFGYNNVKDIMSVPDSDYPSFAAVDIDDGNMYSRGGEYRSYFGKATAYGIDAAGGYMAVEDGTFSAIEAGTCIRCDYAAVDNYAEVADSEYLRISGGTYNSQWGNTVEVMSGKLVLENGIFNKDATNNGGDGKWSAAIRLIGGAIDGTEALAPEFKITGNNVYGIYADGNDSSIDIKNPTFTFDGDPEFTFNGTAATGIYSSAGKITVANGAFEMNGADENHGVHATGDATITLTDTYVYVKGTNSSGVRSEGGAINAKNLTVTVEIGENQTNINTTAISSEGGDITLTGKTVITSDALGITARGGNRSGNINIGEIDENGSAVGSMTLTTYRGTAVYLNGGKLNLNASFVDITSTIDENCVWGVENATKPYSYDGIRIEGGSLVSNAGTTFTLVHKGAPGVTYNSTDFYEINRTFESKSYAIRVTDADNVTLPNGSVANDVGGGIYVSGGNVTLGKEKAGQDGFTVEARGDGKASNFIKPTGDEADNWHYKTPTSGGNAVEVRGGNLTINSGSYTAAQGNGIVVAGGKNIIKDGYFAGADKYQSGEYQNQNVAGPGASYCLKVFGGKVTVNAGTFGVKDTEGAEKVTTSGAFISGTSEAQQGTATILGGTFKVDGQAGFSIFDYANVTFGVENDINNKNNNIKVSGTAAGIAVEEREASVTITIHGGEFASTATSGNSDGIWYANSNAELKITDGIFTGRDRAGLCFDNFPNSGKVQLSGGTYNGKYTEYETWRGNYYKFGAIGYDAKDYGVIIYDQLQLSAILAEKAKVYDVNNNVIDNNAWIHRDVSNNEKLEILSN